MTDTSCSSDAARGERGRDEAGASARCRHDRSHRPEPEGTRSAYASCSAAERADAVVQLSGAISALQAELGRLVVAVDDAGDHLADGATDVAAWLVMTTGMNRRHGRETVRVAEALESLPELRALFASGAVSLDQIRPITRFATPETDAELARQLPGWSAGQAENLARRLTPKPDDEPTTARNRRELHWRPDHEAGGFRYRGFLPSDQAAAVNAALTALAESAGPDPATGLWDPFAARCADALHDLAVGDRHPGQSALSVLHVDAETVAQAAADDAARSSQRSGAPDSSGHQGPGPEGPGPDRAGPHGTDPAHTMGAGRGHAAGGAPSTVGDDRSSSSDELGQRGAAGPAPSPAPPDPAGSGARDRSSGPVRSSDWSLPPAPNGGGELPPEPGRAPHGLLDGMAIGRDTVLRYLCDCDIEFSVDGPNGTTVGIGRRSRTFPDWMRRHIEARDGTCRFPGCERLIRHIHHNRHWTRDRGPTDSHNCEGFCWAHHHLVHEGGWEVIGDADGEITLISPHGRRLTSRREPIRPTTRASAARISGTTLTIIPPGSDPPTEAAPDPP
ncbi:hypothetical protein BH24ACT4_BH24ACT4_03930 [soil metagenome]